MTILLARRKPSGKGPNNEKNKIDKSTRVRRNAVPQRGCSSEKRFTDTGVNSAPDSKALMVLCSAP